MRREHRFADPVVSGRTDERERRCSVRRAIVDAGQVVAMQVNHGD